MEAPRFVAFDALLRFSVADLRRRVLTDPALERRFMALPEARESASYRVKITLGMKRPMSALGQKRIWRTQFAMSALPPKADIARRDPDVRFVPIADIPAFDIRIFTEKAVTSAQYRRGVS